MEPGNSVPDIYFVQACRERREKSFLGAMFAVMGMLNGTPVFAVDAVQVCCERGRGDLAAATSMLLEKLVAGSVFALRPV